jgi:predicted alpha/beta hydrolase family esterase
MDAAGSLVDSMFLSAPKLAAPFRPMRRIRREEYERQVDFYIDSGYADRPESFFTFPTATPSWSIIESRPYRGGESQLIRYESGYVAKNPLLREKFYSYERNRFGYIVRWTHGDRKRKTVLCHHGYMLGEPRQARKMFRVGRLFSEGLDVALFIAPFHWKRSTGSLMQRGMYLQPDNVTMTCECVGQNMHDLYGAFLILGEMGAPEIGLIGASLGGYNTALFVSLTDIASFGAMMVPAVNFSRPLGPDTARLPFAVDAAFGEKIRRVWELHSPLNFRPKLPESRLLVVASRGDLVCPFDYVQELCRKWGISNRHFLTGGHWLIFNDEERGRAWYGFLRDRGFMD